MDQDDQYVKQLEGIFETFCLDGQTGINKDQLLELCKRLSLDSSCIGRVFELAFSDNFSDEDDQLLDFERFCNCFVTALAEVSDHASTGGSDSHEEQPVEKEDKVKPRLVRGGRSYGRKSAPHKVTRNTTDDVDFNDNARVVDSDHWAGDMMTSSDDADEPNHAATKLYYEPGFGGNYFEANRPVSSLHGVTDKELRKAISSTDTLDCITDASSSSMFHESRSINLFSGLELDSSGTIEVEHLLEMWRRGGIASPELVLKALDLKHFDDKNLIDSCELSTALEKETTSFIPSMTTTSMHDFITIATLTSYKHQLLHVNTQVDHYRHQADKMRDDLERSEIRNSKIIEEVDDRYLTMDQQNERRASGIERRWAKKLSTAQRGFDRERESMLSQANYERDAQQKEIDALHANDMTLRRKIEVLISENDTLSLESTQLYEKLADSERDAQRLRKDLECLLAAKTGDMSDPINTSQEEKFAMIIKEYEAQCRQLADRNDELAIEIESIRGKLRQQEAHDRYSNQDLYREEQLTSPKRKKASRRRDSHSSDLMERGDMEEDTLSCSFDDVESFSPSRGRKSTNSSSSNNYATARMSELERLVEELRREKRKSQDSFLQEKAKLKADLEKDFQIKLENEKGKLNRHDDNRAVEEQQNMTMQLLKEMTRQKDEIDAKYAELKEQVEMETSSGQKELTDLCREFANEKSDLISKHEEKLQNLEVELETVNQRLKDEVKANERFAEQLKIERIQHKEALSSHQDIINKFEHAETTKEDNIGVINAEKLKEFAEKHEVEVAQLKRDHACDLESLKRNMQEKMDDLLAEKQQFQDGLSVCSELERLQESIGAEKQEMHERMQGMREAFEREAVELRHLLDCDKAKLRKQLNEEVATLRQRLAEETEREMKKKRQILEEEEERLKKREDIRVREFAELEKLKEEVGDLEVRNKDLENLLAKSTSSLQEEEEKCRMLEETSRSGEILHLESRINEINRKLTEKEHHNIQLRKQLDVLVDENKERKFTLSSLQTTSDVRVVENSQLKQENKELVDKVRRLQHEHHAGKMENVELNARCVELERLGGSTPVPTPRRRSRQKNEELDERRVMKEKKEMENKINDMRKEIMSLQDRLSHQHVDIVNDVKPLKADDEASSEVESAVSNSSENVIGSLTGRLNRTKSQLTDQMKKTKDLYSKLSKTEILVKDLYCENAHLMRALQVTEARQKDAERKCQDEKDRSRALGQILQQVCPEVS